jgi:phosphoheptose isomerase
MLLDIKERMQAVMQAEAEAISAVQIDDSFVRAVETMLACKGKIVTTGIGKAGYLAQKFAATLCSTATPAVFIHPAEAAHGDLGLVATNDVMLAFSTSGKSNEVIEILELSRHLGVETISDRRALPAWIDAERVDGSDAGNYGRTFARTHGAEGRDTRTIWLASSRRLSGQSCTN